MPFFFPARKTPFLASAFHRFGSPFRAPNHLKITNFRLISVFFLPPCDFYSISDFFPLCARNFAEIFCSLPCKQISVPWKSSCSAGESTIFNRHRFSFRRDSPDNFPGIPSAKRMIFSHFSPFSADFGTFLEAKTEKVTSERELKFGSRFFSIWGGFRASLGTKKDCGLLISEGCTALFRIPHPLFLGFFFDFFSTSFFDRFWSDFYRFGSDF